MTFEELQSQVGQWHRKTFSPDCINTRLGLKLVEEAKEFLLMADLTAVPNTDAMEEAADCLIVLMAWAERNNADLIGAAAAKLEILKGRDQKARDAERGIIEPTSDKS